MNNFGIDKRIIIAIIMALLAYQVIASGKNELLILILSIPGVFIAFTFHEYAHALVADKLGDDTPRMQGRLTLDPTKHIDWLGFVFLLIAKFGWAKPVQINPNNFNRKMSVSKAEALVSLAGPLANLIVAFIVMIINAILFKTNILVNTSYGIYVEFAVLQIVLMNIGLRSI